MNTAQQAEKNLMSDVCRAECPSPATLLRRQARVMRTEAIKLEELADQVGNLTTSADETLWKILVNHKV